MLAGIDLGGTQVRVALARSDGRLIASVKTKTPLLKTPQGMVDWAAAEIDRLRGNQKVTSIAIGAPGPIDLKRGILVNPPNLPWRNVPLVSMLGRATGAKVHLANDADMAGLGEFYHGAGRGTRHMVYITWSTGIGGGLIIDGRLHAGPSSAEPDWAIAPGRSEPWNGCGSTSRRRGGSPAPQASQLGAGGARVDRRRVRARRSPGPPAPRHRRRRRGREGLRAGAPIRPARWCRRAGDLRAVRHRAGDAARAPGRLRVGPCRVIRAGFAKARRARGDAR